MRKNATKIMSSNQLITNNHLSTPLVNHFRVTVHKHTLKLQTIKSTYTIFTGE